MNNAEIDKKIDRIEKIEKCLRKCLTFEEPTLYGYKYYEIENAKSYKIKNTNEEASLFGQLSLFENITKELVIYQEYQSLQQKLTTKAAIIRKIARKFNLKENDVKGKIKKRVQQIENDKMNRVKSDTEKITETEIEKLIKTFEETKMENKITYAKLDKLDKYKKELISVKYENDINNKLDVCVKMNLRHLEGVRFNNLMSGSLRELAKLITKEEFLIALVNNRVEVTRGNVEAYKNISFLERIRRAKNRCHKCTKELDYNTLGVNKKLGRTKDYLCIDCLGVPIEHFYSIVESYKRTGCNMFI